MEVEDDAPHLDLEGEQDCKRTPSSRIVILFMPAYDLDLLDKIGMDAEFLTI
jgi:hypothetical protein